MKYKKKFADLIGKYKHAWVLLYAFIYLPWFFYLEKHVTSNYYVIHTAIDDRIPFVEIFIIPYLLWFAFIAVVFLYFFFTDVPGFYNLCKFMFAGMTIFLIVSTLMPNGLELRPTYFERDNIFVDMVRQLYLIDTPTNVLPSLHVFNSLSACAAIYHSEKLQEHKAVCISAYVLAALIVLATVFLKQHSVIDVVAAFAMAAVLHQLVYEPSEHRVLKVQHRQESFARR